VFPENIQTPTTEGISIVTPPTTSDFPFPQDKVNPLTLRISKKKYLSAPVSLEIVFLPLKGFKS